MKELDWNEPLCDETGRCQAPDGARDITNCIYCGKELREKGGAWYTWDADNHPNPRIQCYVVTNKGKTRP